MVTSLSPLNMAHDKSFKPAHRHTQRTASGVHLLLFLEAERQKEIQISIVAQTLQQHGYFYRIDRWVDVFSRALNLFFPKLEAASVPIVTTYSFKFMTYDIKSTGSHESDTACCVLTHQHMLCCKIKSQTSLTYTWISHWINSVLFFAHWMVKIMFLAWMIRSELLLLCFSYPEQPLSDLLTNC